MNLDIKVTYTWIDKWNKYKSNLGDAEMQMWYYFTCDAFVGVMNKKGIRLIGQELQQNINDYRT